MTCTLVCRKIVPRKDDWNFQMDIRDALSARRKLTHKDAVFLLGMCVGASDEDKKQLQEMIDWLAEGGEISLNVEC